MANLSDRTPGNMPGRYYVDSSCIDCDQCRVLAPNTFARDPDTGLGYVKAQPQSDEDVALAEEAFASCATGSIGNDGK